MSVLDAPMCERCMLNKYKYNPELVSRSENWSMKERQRRLLDKQRDEEIDHLCPEAWSYA